MNLKHPVKRPFPRVTWEINGRIEHGELIGITPDNKEGVALTSNGRTFWRPLDQFKPA